MLIYFIAGFVVIVLLFCTLPFFIKVEFEYSKGRFAFSWFLRPPILPMYFNLTPVLQLSGRQRVEKKKTTKIRLDSGSRDETGGFNLEDILSNFKIAAQAVKIGFTGVKITGFCLVARIGSGDAFHTAILCGTISTFLPVFFVLASRMGINFSSPPEVRIIPLYGETNLEFSGKTIVETSVLTSLSTLVKVARLLKKRKTKRGFWKFETAEY